MRFLFAGLAFFLVACSSTTTVPDSGLDGGALSDGGSDGGPNDMDDAGPGDAGPYCPSGYTFLPDLTDTATTHTYKAAAQEIDPQKQYAAVVETDVGRMVWSLNSTVAPIATNSLVFLALNHYFDGIAFHRVIDGFVAQGGDPNTISANRSTWGMGGPGYTFVNEVSPSLNFTGEGILAMANTGQPDSNGSQFFITFAAQPSLDQLYTIFGTVTEGSAVLPLIARGTGPMQADPPTTPTRITALYICEM
jgi:peptidylprolyl isomerase